MTDLNAALPLPVRSDEALARLAVRRSASAQLLAAPGPSEAEIERGAVRDSLTVATAYKAYHMAREGELPAALAQAMLGA